MKTPEGWEKDDICEYLDSIGAWYIRPATYGYGKSGIPDILALFRGRWIAIEVKRPGKEPTPLQKRRMAEILDNGGFSFWGTADKVISELEDARRFWL